jgi:hypothetical protein
MMHAAGWPITYINMNWSADGIQWLPEIWDKVTWQGITMKAYK